MTKTGRFLFWPGQVVVTPGAMEAFNASGDLPFDFLMRHMTGDWGEVSAEDVKANEVAVEQGLRVLSAYRLQDGTKFWIITEADRSSTCFLLPEEY